MSERDQDRKQKYRRVRSDFDELDSEDKVVFLLEATVSTLARGIDAFGRAVSEELNRAFDRRSHKKSSASGETENGAAAGSEAATDPFTSGDGGPASDQGGDGGPGSEQGDDGGRPPGGGPTP